MKQKDVTLIVIIAFLSAIVSFILSGKIFVTPANRQQPVEVVDNISTQFKLPDSRYFNTNSINPTVTSQLGTDTNQNPFNNTTK